MESHLKNEVRGGVFAQCDLGTIHSEYAGIAARSAASRGHARAGEEAELHKSVGKILGQLNPLDNARLAFAQIGKLPAHADGGALESSLDTELHLCISVSRQGKSLSSPPNLSFTVVA